MQVRPQAFLGLLMSWICASSLNEARVQHSFTPPSIGRAALTRVIGVSLSVAQATISHLRRLRLVSAFQYLDLQMRCSVKISLPHGAGLGKGFR